MEPDDKLAQWAALFLSAQAGVEPDRIQASPAVDYPGVTPAARTLLQSVDAGGVPAFVTSNLRQIALENGIDIGDQWTPNQIIDAIRGKSLGT